MMGSFVQWALRTAISGLVWALIFSLKLEGQMVFDHIHEKVLTHEVVGILEGAIEEVWTVWIGEDHPQLPQTIDVKQYRVER